jgi:hypothetical protein
MEQEVTIYTSVRHKRLQFIMKNKIILFIEIMRIILTYTKYKFYNGLSTTNVCITNHQGPDFDDISSFLAR